MLSGKDTQLAFWHRFPCQFLGIAKETALNSVPSGHIDGLPRPQKRRVRSGALGVWLREDIKSLGFGLEIAQVSCTSTPDQLWVSLQPLLGLADPCVSLSFFCRGWSLLLVLS